MARELTTLGHLVEIWTVRRDGLPARGTVDGRPVRRLPSPLPAWAGAPGGPGWRWRF